VTHKAGACVLCGSETTDTRAQLVEWTDPVGGRWSVIPRCLDRAACRYRVEVEINEPWPVRDTTPAPMRASS
jgi:hypothetical protein